MHIRIREIAAKQADFVKAVSQGQGNGIRDAGVEVGNPAKRSHNPSERVNDMVGITGVRPRCIERGVVLQRVFAHITDNRVAQIGVNRVNVDNTVAAYLCAHVVNAPRFRVLQDFRARFHKLRLEEVGTA